MPLDRDEVRRIAALAHLRLTEPEIDRFAAEMAAILDFARTVQSVDTGGIPPTSHPIGGTDALRDDTPRPSIDRTEVLDGAPDAAVAAGLFRVPRVISRDE